MKVEKILQSIWCLFLEITAIFAGKIKIYNEKQIANYELIIILLYNGIFSTFFSAIGSFFVALALSLFTKNLYSDWYVFFKIFMILNCLLLFVNLSSKTLNVPMIFMRVIFSLKNKFHSVGFFLAYIIKLYIVVGISVSILCFVLLHSFAQYGVKDEYSFIYALILSVGLTIAGVYSFPVKKIDRDINELIVSPIFIVLNIGIGYITSKANILNNARQGHEDMAQYLLILFLIAAFVQVITYLKKLFEMLHQLSEYEKDINSYANKGKKRFVFLKGYFKGNLIKFDQVIKDFKSIKKAKHKFLLLISSSLIMALGTIYFSRGIEIGINYLGEIIVLFKLDKFIVKILVYIILLGLFLFLSFKLYIFLVLAFKGKNVLKRSERWEYFSLALFIFGILMVIVANVFSIELSSNSFLVAGGCILVASTILSGVNLIEWLLRKRKTEEKEEI
ncbi:teichoic acid transporter [Bacillus cereus group sp. N28]|uniref:Teichoic acid transporter n=1 Tax=Bacillus mycoides TaxID=1405 RepID=A0A1S9T0K4_BACMY|nr:MULTISPECIES: hypothetical protein [Bacillus cereus group]EJR95851.1 hypothetical protein IKO_05648 [Bacillus cereus VDM034]MBJ7961375.1 teichoic acid transporter [Bacillus cereus group sp. N28]OOR03470.1 teichoic acid transporter [Bacillus mycoides]QWI25408.1 teichoic acid transporter [Bacillus mycoides]